MLAQVSADPSDHQSESEIVEFYKLRAILATAEESLTDYQSMVRVANGNSTSSFENSEVEARPPVVIDSEIEGALPGRTKGAGRRSSPASILHRPGELVAAAKSAGLSPVKRWRATTLRRYL
jgi:hypothetical protein